MAKQKREKRDPAQVTAAEFISALLPPSPNEPALGDPCTVVSNPWAPKGSTEKYFGPLVFHEGASYAPEMYVNWSTCRVVEYVNSNGQNKVGVRVTNAAWEAQYFLMLDDIGDPKKSCLTLDDERVKQATYLIETSPGNYQCGYAFVEPLDAKQSAQLRAACIAAGIGDKGALKSAHRWCRVPGSQHVTKNFKARLVEWHPERIYTLAELCELLDIFLDSKVEAPGVTDFDMPDDIDKYQDAHFRWMRTLPRGTPGSIIGARRSTGFFPIVCPWHEEHTKGIDGTAYRPGFGDSPPAFNCQHSHGEDIKTAQFIDWCIEQRGLAVETQMPSSPDEPVVIEADDFWNFNAVVSAEYPDWLVEELFARKQVGAIFGEPYAGKSTLAFSITMALAGGADVLGDLDQWEGDVGAVYFALEGNLRTRTEPFMREKLLAGVPRIRFERTLELAMDDQSGFEKIAALVARAKELDPRTALVVIDTLARASGVDENTADMGKIAEFLRQIAEENNVCVLVVHHSGKDQSKGLRGHSSFFAALDFAIEVQVVKDGEGKVQQRTFNVTKQREGEGNLIREFEIKGVELGRHPKRMDKRVSGPLAIVKGGDAKKMNPKLDTPKGKNNAAVYATLRTMLSKATAHPEAKRTSRGWGVPTEALVTTSIARLPMPPAGKHDRRRELVMRSLKDLGQQDWVWFIEEGAVQYVVGPRFGGE